MDMYSRFTTALAVIAMLALGGASTARAQDTSSAARSDTMGYKPSQSQTDTSTAAAARAGAAGAVDTVVCKDGQNAGRTQGCSSHGGIDWAATKAALKARGIEIQGDSSSALSDTTQVNKQGAGNYQYHGAPSDTALKAKPGTQTGADTNATKSDTGTGR
jgi:hypothetical protein